MKKKLATKICHTALAVAIVGSSAVSLVACKPAANAYTLDVYIFCTAADQATNKAICDSWAQKYSEEHAQELGGNKITVNFQPEPNSATYFTNLQQQIKNNDYADIVYLSPKNVVSYAQQGHVLDLTSYIEADNELVEQLESIWSKSLAFYATYGSSFGRRNATDIAYDEASGQFIDTASGQKANIYGLPKDYSNFALGVNQNYFTDTMKAAYTTLKASTPRNVTTRLLNQSNWVEGTVTHKGTNAVGSSSPSITYAVDGECVNPYTGESVSFKAGDEAPFVAIGVPVNYKPFNFYKYANYDDALSAGDPMAASVATYTGGEGYTVVIPGFPGETFAIEKDAQNAYNEDAAYDADVGHVVLTWTEYSALNWACAYLLNSYSWCEKNPENGHARVKSTDNAYAAWLSGPGGYYTGAGGNNADDTEVSDYYNVYGGEQYEQGSFGANAYVNPWLYSNDASFIDATNTKSVNESRNGVEIASKQGGSWSWTGATTEGDILSYIGNQTEDVEKTNLDGTTRSAKNQYGMNSENFVEAYGAFQEYCATWNAHVGQAGDVVNSAADKGFNGQNAFVVGASLFYGVGTWDVSEYQEVPRDVLDVGIVPTAVSNRLALYVETRDAFYSGDGKKAYSNGAAKQTGDGVNREYEQRGNLSAGKKVYSEAEIEQNQLLRQDKWGGRMDSVGYAVNANVANGKQPSWKAPAAVSLVLALTVDADAQVTLTYGGAQIPNVVSQCSDYLNYNTTAQEGVFKDMITPEGDAQGNDVWDEYYAIALEMANEAFSGKSRQTVAQFMSGKKVNGEDAKYDAQYANVRLSDFTTGTTSQTCIAYAMRVLRMINYSREQRDLSIRMQYMNSARQQSLYTPGELWITTLNATETSAAFLAYRNQASLIGSGTNMTALANFVAKTPAQAKEGARTLKTPALYCVQQVLASQTRLDNGQ